MVVEVGEEDCSMEGVEQEIMEREMKLILEGTEKGLMLESVGVDRWN